MPNKVKISVDTTNKVSSKKKNKREKNKSLYKQAIVTDDGKSVDTQVSSSKVKNKRKKTVEVAKNKFKSKPKGKGKTLKERTRSRTVTRYSSGGVIQHD